MKRTRLAILVVFLVALVFWLFQRSTPNSANVTNPIKSAVNPPPAKPITAQVAPPVVAAVNPSKPYVPTAADLPANFDPRAQIAKDEMYEYLQEMVKTANEGLTPEREKGEPEGWIVSEEVVALEYKYCLDATPALNDAGDIATYAVDDAAWAEMKAVLTASKDPPRITEPPTLQFAKMNGEWQEIEEEPEKDPFAH